ncbi:MAG: LamB/YcsF family protein [Bryobacterales bacterium]|nr:LamB/YcsF family protein [Bryobacterales bacterium]
MAKPMLSIDLNCDMAELPELAASGVQDALLDTVSSVNVACGAHAGDPELILQTIRSAVARGVAVGAHPGFPDRENFGREPMAIEAAVLLESLRGQLRLVAEIADSCAVALRHVKPHGALYNLAARDCGLAATIAQAAREVLPGVAVITLAGAPCLRIFGQAGLAVIPEAFADRRYEADGSLRHRRYPDALITSPREAAEQALSIARDGLAITASGETVPIVADTLCLHSDTPGAPALAAAVRSALEAEGFRIAPATTSPATR